MDATRPAWDMQVFLTLFLTYLVPHIPEFLICLVGIILALVWRRRHRGVSRLTIAAFLLMLFTALASSAWAAFGTTRMLRFEGPRVRSASEAYASWLLAGTILFGLVRLVYLGLLLAAIFSGRRPMPPMVRPAPRPAGGPSEETVQIEMPAPAPAQPSEHIRRADDSYRP